jgi:hypothetical protein
MAAGHPAAGRQVVSVHESPPSGCGIGSMADGTASSE